MTRLLAVAVGLLLAVCFSAAASTPKVIDTFAVESTPGEGNLTYSLGDKNEPVPFGTAAGNYALGLAIPAKFLPSPYREDFKNNLMIQVTFGALKSKSPELTPQFGAATLVVGAVPAQKVFLRLLIPRGSEATLKNTGMFLFTAPSSPATQSDEEKLKSTFFANAGTFNLSPEGKPEAIFIKSGGKNYPFKRVTLVAEIDANLSTPFNPQTSKLSGTMKFPLYWPNGKDAEALTTRIARESLGAQGELALPIEKAPKTRAAASAPKRADKPPVDAKKN